MPAISSRDFRTTAVQLVAEDRTAKVAEMNANLVRSTGFRHTANDREPAKTLEDLEKGLRRLGVGVVRSDRHTDAEFRMMTDRLVDDFSIRIDRSERYRQIFLFDALFFKKGGKVRMRNVVFRNDDDAARVAVEPMNDSRPGGTAVRAQLAREAMRKRADQRPGPMAARRMHDHVGGLIDDRQIVVFIEDVERDLFGNRGLSWRFDESERHDRARLQAKRRLAVDPVGVGASSA